MRGPIGHTDFVLKEYQQDAFDDCLRAWQKHRGIVVKLPTGTGKTVLASFLIRWHLENVGTPVLFLNHTEPLIAQTVKRLGQLGIPVAVEKAEDRAKKTIRLARTDFFDPRDIRCVVGSNASFRGARLLEWDRHHFGLIVFDEVHHAAADTNLCILEHFNVPTCKILGLTATPRRDDGRCISVFFDVVAHQISLKHAIRQGWLAPVELAEANCPLDLSPLNPRRGDYTPGDLETLMWPLVAQMSNALAEVLSGTRRPFLNFTPNVRTARAFADALTGLGLSCTGVAGEDSDKADRIAEFENGRVHGLSCCTLLAEGFDYPPTAAIGVSRPTKSLTLLEQIIGRGTRLADGKKDCLVIDFPCVVSKARGRVVRPFELFKDDDLSEREELECYKALAQGKPLSPAAMQDAGKKEVQRMDEEARRRQEELAEARRAKVRAKKRDSGITFTRGIFLAGPGQAPDARYLYSSGQAKGPRATEKQAYLLARYGMDFSVAASLSKREASDRIDYLQGRHHSGLAGPKLLLELLRLGLPQAEAEAYRPEAAVTKIAELKAGQKRRA